MTTPADDTKWATTQRCDGSPVHPDAIPPVPLHDERWDGDDPYLVCRLCGRLRDALTGRVLVAGNAPRTTP